MGQPGKILTPGKGQLSILVTPREGAAEISGGVVMKASSSSGESVSTQGGGLMSGGGPPAAMAVYTEAAEAALRKLVEAHGRKAGGSGSKGRGS